MSTRTPCTTTTFLTRCSALLLLIGLSAPFSAFGSTLSKIQNADLLTCSTAGHVTTPRDYETPGTIAGFDRDYCRAIAAAVLKDSSKIKFVFLIPQNRFEALQEGAIDVLVRSTTWTLSRDAELGVHFAATNFYDGQGFVAPKSLGIKNLKELKSNGKTARACIEKSTTSEDNIAEYIRDNGLPITLKRVASFEEVRYAFLAGDCDLFSADRSFLVEFRLKETPIPGNYVLLEDVISKEPLGTVVRDDDAHWFNIVRWVSFAVVQAEELGITSQNVDTLRTTGNSAQRRFLGAVPGMGKPLGLDDGWAYRVIQAVGNYGEIFHRNLGNQTDFNMDRGLNKLWNQGGLLYAPPFR
ncbi:amino acid ABC transporter substrate-binding protein [Magnetovibrio sp. PR-2]|uniref:amino acid ABC transporter substrate-binding protein n=1 Tax=Magnetovibrio sp. PR-2 TaxID=3120356 RepID=UPI002FCE40D9